jgi:hypothetical protein
VVFAAETGPKRNVDIFVINADGTDMVRLTRHEAVDEEPCFSADGRRMFWSSSRWDGRPRLTGAVVLDEGPFTGSSDITAGDVRHHIETLASGDMEGRMAGSLGGEMATSYIAGCFRRFGLRPAGDDGTWFQGIDFVCEIRAGADNALSVRVGEETLDAKPGVDFKPFRFTKNGAVEADAVAVGYGIVLPGGREDDYAGWEVAGRAAVALDGAPREWEKTHPDQKSQASVRRKAAAAAEKKAAALLIIGDLSKDTGDRGPAGETAALPAARVSRDFWDRVIAKAGKADVLIRVSLKTDMVPVRRWTCNVVGVWPGSSCPGAKLPAEPRSSSFPI